MYEKMLAMVMKDDVTLQEWKDFRTYFESLPDLRLKKAQSGVIDKDEVKKACKRSQDFANAAFHVASILPLEDIAQDVGLMLAYEEIHHPQNFS